MSLSMAANEADNFTLEADWPDFCDSVEEGSPHFMLVPTTLGQGRMRAMPSYRWESTKITFANRCGRGGFKLETAMLLTNSLVIADVLCLPFAH